MYSITKSNNLYLLVNNTTGQVVSSWSTYAEATKALRDLGRYRRQEFKVMLNTWTL